MAKKSFLIIGAGRFGGAVAETLFAAGHEVVVLDRDAGAIDRIMPTVTDAMITDGTEERILRDLGASNFDAVVVAIGNDLEASVMATVAAKDAGARRVVAKAFSRMAARILTRVGADEVVLPEHDMGVRLANHLATPNLIDAFRLGDSYGVIEVTADERLDGRLARLRLPDRFGVQLIAVDRGGSLTIAPSGAFDLQRGDRLVFIGTNESIARLEGFLAS
jgi:trk system potassium uptake protein